jgi:hypothetical protein
MHAYICIHTDMRHTQKHTHVYTSMNLQSYKRINTRDTLIFMQCTTQKTSFFLNFSHMIVHDIAIASLLFAYHSQKLRAAAEICAGLMSCRRILIPGRSHSPALRTKSTQTCFHQKRIAHCLRRAGLVILSGFPGHGIGQVPSVGTRASKGSSACRLLHPCQLSWLHR